MRSISTRAAMLALAAISVCAPGQAQRAVIVVRHAEKVSDTDERLSDAGRARAARLAEMLRDAGVTAIYSTDTERTRDTVRPLAEALKLPIRTYDVGGQTVDARHFATGLRERYADGVVLVVGHSNTVPALLQALGCAEAITIGPADYDNLFVVVPRDAKATLIRLRY